MAPAGPSASDRTVPLLLMNPEIQTLLALVVVAVAATWLVRRMIAKRKNPGCGTECGAVSPEIKRLQAHLARRK
jgi:membrane protein implicated in regulation of membrane protease activity